MKRLLAILLAAAVCLSLCGCGSKAKIEALEERVAILEYRLEQLEQSQPAPEIQPGEDVPQDSFADDPSPAEALRREISTVEEAAAFLDSRFPELWMSAHLTDGVVDYFWLAPGEEIVMRQSFEAVGRSCVVNALTYLLGDDMEISTVLGFWHDESGGCPIKAINCIKTDSGYRFVDPVLLMRGDEMSRYGQLLPEAEVETLEDYVQVVLSDSELSRTLDSLYLFEDGGYIQFQEEPGGWVNLQTEGARELYLNRDNYISPEEYRQMHFGHVKPENIGAYRLSSMLGGTTLTAQQAYDLVDADPETVKQQVKTAADVLMYMLAAQIGDNGGCNCDNWGGYTWHTNFSAKEVMEKKLSNCGASANLANYLLEGDYEEVGIILHAYYPGNGGGHVYNYFLHNGKYYIVDFSWYIFGNYEVSQDFPVMELKALEAYNGQKANELYGGVSLVIAHTSTGRHLPNIFGEEFGDNHYYVPAGAEYQVLYEAGDGYLIGEMPLDRKYHDWTKFW